MKKILKILCQIYILMKKVIILRKLHKCDNKVFPPSSFNRSSLSLNRKKTCGNENHEKETKHIHASAADLLHIRVRNFDWCKCSHCKSEAREMDCLYRRVVGAMLIVSAKILELEGSIWLSSFYWQLPNY